MADVLVLGAGLAGLSCARDLVRGGADVTVVEARDRPDAERRFSEGRMAGGAMPYRRQSHLPAESGAPSRSRE